MRYILRMKIISKYTYFYYFSALLLLAIVLLLEAWLTDDMMITYRVIDNVFQGHGLRWNIDERVEVYTHPLWMFLHVVCYFFVDNLFLISVGLSLLCMLLSVYFLIKWIPQDKRLLSMVWLVSCLVLSNSITQTAVSGFENPLSWLIIAIFTYRLIRDREQGHISWFMLSLCCSAALLTRMDLALLFAPPMIYLVIKYGRTFSVMWKCFLGLLPFITWKLFAFWYYGFIFPNTKYAKLSESVSQQWYIEQGVIYLYDLIFKDTVGAALLLAALFLTAQRWKKDTVYSGAEKWFGVGLLCYIGYVIAIGGCYISGRLWSVPIVVSLIFVLQYVMQLSSAKLKRYGKIWAVVCVISVGTAFLTDGTAFRKFFEKLGVGDIGANMKEHQSHLIDLEKGEINTFPVAPMYIMNKIYLLKGRKIPTEKSYLITGIIGGIGFLDRGDDLTVIDPFGIADVFLARLPVQQDNFSVGHYYRKVPKEYLEFRLNDTTKGVHPSLLAYIQALREITSGDLWSMERLKTIIAFNFGAYDHHLEEYLRYRIPFKTDDPVYY